MEIHTLQSETVGPFTLSLVEVTEQHRSGELRDRSWEVHCGLCDTIASHLTRQEADQVVRSHACT